MYIPHRERHVQVETKSSEAQTAITSLDTYCGKNLIPSQTELQKLTGDDYAYAGCVLKTCVDTKIVQSALVDDSVQKDCGAV